jgi:cation transport ATPase
MTNELFSQVQRALRLADQQNRAEQKLAHLEQGSPIQNPDEARQGSKAGGQSIILTILPKLAFVFGMIVLAAFTAFIATQMANVGDKWMFILFALILVGVGLHFLEQVARLLAQSHVPDRDYIGKKPN